MQRLIRFLAALVLGVAFSHPFAQSTWTLQEKTFLEKNLSCVAWTGSLLVAVGPVGTAFTSPDGMAWKEIGFVSKFTLAEVVWTGTQLVAVGDSGTIMTSKDGSAWQAQSSGTRNRLYSVAWSGSLLTAVGAHGLVLTSPDGMVWTPRTTALTEDVWMYAVTWAGSRFVAVGDGGTTVTSSDGVTWTTYAGSVNVLSGVTWTGLSSPRRTASPGRPNTVRPDPKCATSNGWASNWWPWLKARC